MNEMIAFFVNRLFLCGDFISIYIKLDFYDTWSSATTEKYIASFIVFSFMQGIAST